MNRNCKIAIFLQQSGCECKCLRLFASSTECPGVQSQRNPMTDSRCPVFLIIAVLGLQLTIPALGQSHPTVPGQSLESMKGVTDPNAMNEAWQTALMAAAFNSDEKLVKDLIERKANVNVGSRFGMTALMYARGLPVAKLLLSAGASVKDKDITGKTALYWATQRADPEVVQVLLEAGASVNAKDDKGMSAPQLAKAELLSSENDFSDKDMRDAYKARVQKVIDLLVASEARKDYP